MRNYGVVSRPQEDPEVKKAQILLVIFVLAVFALAAIPNSLPGRMELFVKSPLLLSVLDSDGNPGSAGRVVHKFGRNDTPAAGDDIWDCSEVAIGGPATYPHQAAAYTLYVSSDAAGDTTQEITVEGIDANWDRQVVTADLNGVVFVPVGTASNWRRVYRAYNSSGTVFAGNIYLNNDATDAGGDGIPDVLTGLQGCIQIGNEQTLMSIYTTADNEYTWITQYCATALDATPGTPGYATTLAMIRANLPASQTFRVSTVFGLGADGTSDRCESFNPPIFIPPRTDIKFRSEAITVDSTTATFNMVVITAD
jgi:hypothetical protein